MKVKDLIEQLQKVDPNLPVVVMDTDLSEIKEEDIYRIRNGYVAS